MTGWVGRDNDGKNTAARWNTKIYGLLIHKTGESPAWNRGESKAAAKNCGGP